MIYDLIIVGLGPSGISAAIYAKRASLNVLCLEKTVPGGLLNKLNKVENYPGFKSISGPDLAYSFFEQLNEQKISYKMKEVTNIISGDIIKVQCNDEIFETKNLIISTGRSAKKIGLENEKKFLGKGISYCALCDAALYKNLPVAIIGNNEEAINEAIEISKIVGKVYFINKEETINGISLVDKFKDIHNIVLKSSVSVTKLIGEDKLSTIELSNQEQIEVDCLFTYMGYTPQSSFIESLNITNNLGYIKVNENYQTTYKNIYAVGDAIEKTIYQIVTATSEGATASINIAKNIKNKN